MRVTFARTLVALVLGAGSALWGGTSASAAEEVADYDCASIRPDSPEVATAESPSQPFGLLRMADAWESLAREGMTIPGADIGVAVIDNGIRTSASLRAVPAVTFAGTEIADPHGTSVAGLIAGRVRRSIDGAEPMPVGFAPGARLLDVRFYDSPAPDDSQVGPGAERLARALTWVADNARQRNIRVANVSVAVAESDGQITRAVKRVLAADVVLVAASGNRPQEEGAPFSTRFSAEPKPGEDAASLVFPAAADPDVLVVNATPEGSGSADASASVLFNSATDVAAPTAGAVSASVTGGTCILPEVSSEWAAAEVTGLVALMRQRYPRDNARQIMARVRRSASGVPAIDARTADPLTGAGVIQPVAALERGLRPGRDGLTSELSSGTGGDSRAKAPPVRPDVLAPTRDQVIWVGLLGGAAVVVAALLRPLVERLRRRRA